MKAIAALGKLVGPALGAIIIQGVDLENGDHLSGGQLAGMLFDLAVRSRADADARARLEELIGGLLPKLGAALEALDVEQLEELVARFMVGASAVQVGDAGATPIVLIEQIDQVFPDAITLVGALRFAIKANLLPFIAKNTARSS
ncbi:MAG: hypothetical protein KC457_03005 [Myxococcales bacterium]|nr:hypothetical protein [Myxococcales bacterium]